MLTVTECTNEAIAGNYPLLKQLYTDLTGEEYHTRIQELRAIGYRQAGIIDNGVYVAVTGFHTASHLSSGKYLYVDDLVVDSNHRAKRYGRSLLHWLEEEAKRLGCHYIFLDAFVENQPAHTLYHSQGFGIAAFHFIKSLESGA